METTAKTAKPLKGVNTTTRTNFKRGSYFDKIIKNSVKAAAFITISLLLIIIGYIVIMGVPKLSLQQFELQYNSTNVSMLPAIVNTVSLIVLALAVSVPIGIASAIFLHEYAQEDHFLVGIIRIAAETLAGIPSIVYGLFGFLLFALHFRWGYSLLGGVLTLAIMVLPTIMLTAENALKSVPVSYREASFALGAGKLHTVMKVVLPAAVPGILAGIILSIGRIAGETAALIYTAGTVAGIAVNWMDSARTLSVHMYALLSEGLYMEQAYATAVVLLVMVLAINIFSGYLLRKVSGSEFEE